MKKPLSCRMCTSTDIEVAEHDDEFFAKCHRCGFDELDIEEDFFPEEKVSQKAKGRFTPYKTGGKARSKK